MTCITVGCNSSGNSNSGSMENVTVMFPIDAIYTGTADVIFETNETDLVSDTFTISITIQVTDGMVTVRDIDGDNGTAALRIETLDFNVPVQFTQNEEGINCRGIIRYAGTIADGMIAGNLTGGSICTENGQESMVTTSGTFSANHPNLTI